MNTKMKWFTAVSCAIVALSVCTACQDDDMSQQPTDPATNVHTYRIVADVDAAPDGDGTRALTEDASKVIHSNWLQNDKMIAYCLNDKDKSTEKQYNLLTSATEGKGSRFDGTFKSVNAINTNDEICFFYPGAASVGEEATITSTMRMEGDGKKTPSVYYENQPTIKQTVELDLTEQDGTAKTIGEKFDYQWAKAKPAAVKGTDVKVKWVKMQRQIAIWGLRFANDEGKILTNIDSVYISGVKSLDVFNLGTGKFIEDNVNDESDNIVLKPANDGKFTSASGKYTYAATLPGTYARVLITVFVGDKCYAREYNNIKLEADKVYRTDVINMPQTVANPFVEVQGVKWATGNFIHYGVEGSGEDYWGIAPTQWWISQYHIQDKTTNKWITSQFVHDGLVADPEDLDMFRFGDIASATKVNVGEYKSGSYDIMKQYYSAGGVIDTKVTDRSKAKFGDIVWYYTENNNQKYRMPKGDELKLLYEKANVIPAYCYSNLGDRIYGAFFYTNNGARKKTFPTGVNALHKYTNVTALVRANKGLFLPITGRRESSNKAIGYRDMTYSAGAYAQYMSSNSSTSELCREFFFGPSEWNFSPNGKGYAVAIRPVWDEKSTTTPDPVFPAFKDIH